LVCVPLEHCRRSSWRSEPSVGAHVMRWCLWTDKTEQTRGFEDFSASRPRQKIATASFCVSALVKDMAPALLTEFYVSVSGKRRAVARYQIQLRRRACCRCYPRPSPGASSPVRQCLPQSWLCTCIWRRPIMSCFLRKLNTRTNGSPRRQRGAKRSRH